MSYTSAVVMFFFVFIAVPSFVKFGAGLQSENVTDFINVLIPLLVGAAFMAALAS